MTRRKSERTPFSGFDRPESNYFRMPNTWTDITAEIDNIAELKVVEYILRHTWGYQEYGEKKHITIDEFVKGRRRHDSSRMDHGTGLSERAVYDGLRLAREDGLIEEAIDDSDRGRVKKSYSLRMRTADEREISNTSDLQDLQPGVQTLHPGLQKLQGRGAKTAARSEKYTQERQENNFEIRKIAHDLNEFERIGTRGADGLLDQAEIPSIGSHGSAEDEPRESIENPAIPGEAKLGDLIRARQEQAGEFPRRRGRPPGTGDEREIVTAYMRDWAVVELGDEA